jgi:hypothetical protein
MPTGSLTQQWADAFFRAIQTYETATALKDAALKGALRVWTAHLTSAVVTACQAFGWRPAAKGFLGEVLPVARNEYLALDVVAFPTLSSLRWPFPIAVFELENSNEAERVAYSLWKVLCIRAPLRVVFAYQRESGEGTVLVNQLAGAVIGSLPLNQRLALTGETSLIIGSRGEAALFPYGYFKVWTLNANTGRFERA